MHLTLERLSGGPDSTIGAMFVDGRFACFTCEDEHRDIKVAGETRIPAGEYEIIRRTHGGFHQRYKSRFSWHDGMLELRDVPGFTDILIHCGNTEKHTAGCLLVGQGTMSLPQGGGTVQQSVNAYTVLYGPVMRAIQAGDPVSIEIIDRDRLI